jgi:hypothetical protein
MKAVGCQYSIRIGVATHPANHTGDAGLPGGKIPSAPLAVNQAPLPRENEAIGASIRENLLPQRWPN